MKCGILCHEIIELTLVLSADVGSQFDLLLEFFLRTLSGRFHDPDMGNVPQRVNDKLDLRLPRQFLLAGRFREADVAAYPI